MEPYQSQFFTPIPDAADPERKIKDWFYLRRTQVAALASSYTPRSDFGEAGMIALEKKLRNMEGVLATGQQSPNAVIGGFKKWLDEGWDDGAWTYYKDGQEAKDLAESDRQDQEAKAVAINEAKDRARNEVQALSRRNAGGLMSASGKNGRVISALAVVSDPVLLHTGISGQDKHTYAGHPLIAPLLVGTHKAMDWPQEACAEVDALKSYLHELPEQLTAVSQIPRNTLVFHAMVWHPGGNWEGKVTSPRWQDRSACANCDQWLKKIGALRA